MYVVLLYMFLETHIFVSRGLPRTTKPVLTTHASADPYKIRKLYRASQNMPAFIRASSTIRGSFRFLLFGFRISGIGYHLKPFARATNYCIERSAVVAGAAVCFGFAT